jgi:hypothetical protein
MDKKTLLEREKEARTGEVFHYQINIDNFTRAIDKLVHAQYGDLEIQSAMEAFKLHLEKLCKEHIVEQAKAKLMLDVVVEQLENLV